MNKLWLWAGTGLLAVALLLGRAAGDSLTLNTGEIVEGTIVSESSSTVEVELKKYKGIVRKYDVADIQPNSIRRARVPAVVAQPLHQVALKVPETEAQKPFSFSGNGFDFIVSLSSERQAQLSIDPIAIDRLANLKVSISVPSLNPTATLVEAEASKAGLVLNPVELAPNVKVLFLTTPSAWGYYQAIGKIKTGDFQGAYKILADTTADSSAFGNDVTGLKVVLQNILQGNRDLAAMEKHVQSSMESLARADSAVINLEAFAASTSSHAVGQEAAKMAAARAKSEWAQAVASYVKVYNGLLQFDDVMFDHSSPLVSRFREVSDTGLIAEPKMILGQLVLGLTRMKDLHLLAENARGTERSVDAFRELVEKSRSKFDEPPSDIREMQAEMERSSDTVNGTIRQAVAVLGNNPALAEELFVVAHALDRSELIACAGLGYSQVRKHSVSLNQMFRGIDAASAVSERERLIHELQVQQKTHLIEALTALGMTNAPPPFSIRPIKVGSSKGLAIHEDQGAIFGISVSVPPMDKPTPAPQTQAEGYWAKLTRKLRVSETTGEPIVFGDYGQKDFNLLISSVQALKWLRSIEPGMTSNSLGLKIEFHNLLGAKGGDSAGSTIAVSAYSSLKDIGVFQDLAMTGSIRADGAIKAVGGVPEKIEGANREAGVETVLVPYENRANLLVVPVSTLCRLAVITLGDAREYLRYSVSPVPSLSSADARQYAALRNALARLRVAQALLLAGERKVAFKLLREVSATHPEIYNAGRLLELLSSKIYPLAANSSLTSMDTDRIVGGLSPAPVQPPANIQVIPALNQITLKWTPTPGALAYIVARAGDNTTHVTTEPMFIEKDLSPGSSYSYTVTASNDYSTAQSAQIPAVTLAAATVEAAAAASEPWWKKYWYVIVGLVVVLVFFAPRRS